MVAPEIGGICRPRHPPGTPGGDETVQHGTFSKPTREDVTTVRGLSSYADVVIS
jgi:hypothetical protein